MKKKLKEGSAKEERGESKAKERSEVAAGIDKMPAGTPQAPGPINDPSDHPSNNIPNPTDPRWGQVLSPGSQLDPSAGV